MSNQSPQGQYSPGSNSPDSYTAVSPQPGSYTPGQFQPAPFQAGSYAPAPNQPGAYAPGPNQPGPYPPGPNQPGAFAPGPYPPGPNQPGANQPGAFAPGPYPPGPNQPGANQPGAFAPGPYQPGPYQPYPPYQGRPPAGPPEKRPPWAIPVAGIGAALIVAMVGLIIAGGLTGNKAQNQSSAPPVFTNPNVHVPRLILTTSLFTKMNKDIQAKNETAFLSLVAPAAQPAVRSWWANQETIGFTTGAVVPTGEALVSTNAAGNGTTEILAGTHNQFDPTGSDGLPAVPCAAYQIGLHYSSRTATGEITSWKPLDNAPWDQGVQLYAAKSAHVEVVGDQSDRALVNETVPIAEAAAEYDIKLFDNINSKDLRMPGFVVFVSSSASKRDTWLRSGRQPTGWIGDSFGGLTFPLLGAGGSQSDVASKVSDDTIGGSRVIIVPHQDLPNESAQGETQVLVHEFVHDIMFVFNPGFYGSNDPVPDWADEGIAAAIEDLYVANADPAPQQYNFSVLTHSVEALPASYRAGALPSSHEIYGESAQIGANWYDVSASIYEYIALKYGLNQMLASAVLLRTNDSVPFGNVLQSNDNGTFHFYSESTIESGWKAWLAGL